MADRGQKFVLHAFNVPSFGQVPDDQCVLYSALLVPITERQFRGENAAIGAPQGQLLLHQQLRQGRAERRFNQLPGQLPIVAGKKTCGRRIALFDQASAIKSDHGIQNIVMNRTLALRIAARAGCKASTLV